MNNEEWLEDGRKIPDEVMGYIRKMAVQAVRERGQSPEVVAQIFNFYSLTCPHLKNCLRARKDQLCF
jgi:hypothetical protein